MKTYFLLFLLFQFYSCIAQNNKSQLFIPKDGDLIFQESYTGGMGNAIKQVTSGIDGYNFTHVGIVWTDSLSGSMYVIEATHPKVKVTPLQKFLKPDGKENIPPRSVVGRLKEPYTQLIPKALKEALQLVGKEYDDAFDLSNDKYYCSELIYKVLYTANNYEEVFPLNIMTFKSEETKEYSPYWKSHFEKLGIPVPEGELGINPGAMSKSNVITIIYYYPENL